MSGVHILRLLLKLIFATSIHPILPKDPAGPAYSAVVADCMSDWVVHRSYHSVVLDMSAVEMLEVGVDKHLAMGLDTAATKVTYSRFLHMAVGM